MIKVFLGARRLKNNSTSTCLSSSLLFHTEIIHICGITYTCFFLHIIKKKARLDDSKALGEISLSVSVSRVH